MNVTESLLRMTQMAQDNYNILSAINEAFHTKDAHVTTEFQGERFTIPSYISLESKINHLQDGFDNLVHASKAGAAWLNYDGDSRVIYIQGHDQAPSPVTISVPTSYASEDMDLFKDMLTPKPYINLNLKDLPDNITQVAVKKIVPFGRFLELMSTELTAATTQGKTGISLRYDQIKKTILDNQFTEGEDYVEYDATYTLPLSPSLGQGSYIILEVLDDWVDNRIDQYIRIRLDSLDWFTKDLETKTLTKGTILSTWDASCLMRIEEMGANHIITCKVLHGAYCNIVAEVGNKDIVSDASRLRFHAPSEEYRIEKDKSIHIPLEEDRYVYICVSPINSQVNVMAFWSEGIYIDTYSLTNADGVDFGTYYKSQVRNIGDILMELASTSSKPLTSITFEPNIKPLLDEADFQVVQINKHLNNSKAVENIRAQYSLKKQYQLEYEDVQNKLTSLRDEVSRLNFDDTTGTRSMYMAQIHDLQNRQTELLGYISKAMESIAISATDSVIPIADAKFQARGYFDIHSYLQETQATLDDIHSIQVQYRYKNAEIPVSTSTDLNGYLYSEWQTMYSVPISKRLSYEKGSYKVTPEDLNDQWKQANDVKFNQIGVPITQGEVVDIRVRVLWAYGFPGTMNYSQWSDILTIKFPDELIKDVQVKTIIAENNSDIETNRFNNMLVDKGLMAHISHETMDQNIKYYHEANDIMSGFYTQERRVIPLGDKLAAMDATLSEVKALIYGTSATNLQVSIQFDAVNYTLASDIINDIHLPAYSTIKVGEVATGSAYRKSENGYVRIIGTINIKNVSEHTGFLYSMFPGSRDIKVRDLKVNRAMFTREDYTQSIIGNITHKTDASKLGDKNYINSLYEHFPVAHCNQFIYQQFKDIYTGAVLDGKFYQGIDSEKDRLDNQLAWIARYNSNQANEQADNENLFAFLSPNSLGDIQLQSDDVVSKLSIPPGETISIPIAALYYNTVNGNPLSFTLGFDIRNSLYGDPIGYRIRLNSKYQPDAQDILNSQRNSIASSVKYNPVIR